MSDPMSEAQRLARIYDPFDPDRSDLDVYAALLDELGARSVLDIGCGTGTFACLLSGRGVEVVGLDPDAASLEVAHTKAGADRVRWIHGTVVDLPPDVRVDAVTMTANVAQVFLDDDEWQAVVAAAFRCLRPGGHLVFETRDPANRAWLGWTRERTATSAVVPGLGRVEGWLQTTEVAPPFVTFDGEYTFCDEDLVLRAPLTTLRFRSRQEVEASLLAAGFVVVDVRDAPDRPGAELVFIARRP